MQIKTFLIGDELPNGESELNDVGIIKDRNVVREWKRQWRYCMVCGCDCHNQFIGPQVHHIIKRGRSDEPCNFLYVCEQCHRIIEGHRVPRVLGGYWPEISLANVLWFKKEATPNEYNRKRLKELYTRLLPYAKEPDKRYIHEFKCSPAGYKMLYSNAGRNPTEVLGNTKRMEPTGKNDEGTGRDERGCSEESGCPPSEQQEVLPEIRDETSPQWQGFTIHGYPLGG